MTTATLKAPAGGITSPINGQFYAGGEFIPDHGKFCGKGKNRVTVALFEEVKAAVEAMGETLEYSEQYDKGGEFIIRYNAYRQIKFRAKNLGTLAKLYKTP